MIPSDKNLKIRSGTVGYNNKILVSDEKFILGKNEKVNSVPVMKSHKVTQTAARPKPRGQRATQMMCYHTHQIFLISLKNLRQ